MIHDDNSPHNGSWIGGNSRPAGRPNYCCEIDQFTFGQQDDNV